MGEPLGLPVHVGTGRASPRQTVVRQRQRVRALLASLRGRVLSFSTLFKSRYRKAAFARYHDDYAMEEVTFPTSTIHVSSFCMYDVRTLPGRLILRAGLQQHRLSVCSEGVHENPYYVPEHTSAAKWSSSRSPQSRSLPDSRRLQDDAHRPRGGQVLPESKCVHRWSLCIVGEAFSPHLTLVSRRSLPNLIFNQLGNREELESSFWYQ